MADSIFYIFFLCAGYGSVGKKKEREQEARESRKRENGYEVHCEELWSIIGSVWVDQDMGISM